MSHTPLKGIQALAMKNTMDEADYIINKVLIYLYISMDYGTQSFSLYCKQWYGRPYLTIRYQIALK